jgi:hypothetical protein
MVIYKWKVLVKIKSAFKGFYGKFYPQRKNELIYVYLLTFILIFIFCSIY